jgi:hypothetical protein
MGRWVSEAGDHAMVPRALCELLDEVLPPGAARDELRACWPSRWESDFSRPRSTAATAVVLEQDSSTNPQHN